MALRGWPVDRPHHSIVRDRGGGEAFFCFLNELFSTVVLVSRANMRKDEL